MEPTSFLPSSKKWEASEETYVLDRLIKQGKTLSVLVLESKKKKVKESRPSLDWAPHPLLSTQCLVKLEHQEESLKSDFRNILKMQAGNRVPKQL